MVAETVFEVEVEVEVEAVAYSAEGFVVGVVGFVVVHTPSVAELIAVEDGTDVVTAVGVEEGVEEHPLVVEVRWWRVPTP